MSDETGGANRPADDAHAQWWSSKDEAVGRRNNPGIVPASPTLTAPAGAAAPARAPADPAQPPLTGAAYAAAATAAARPAVPTVRAATQAISGLALSLVVGGILMLLGSVTAWATASGGGQSISQIGTAFGGSTGDFVYEYGWVTLTLGILVLLFGALLMVQDQLLFRVIVLLASLGALGYGIYEIVTIQSANSKSQGAVIIENASHVHVGIGLIIAVVGAAIATIAAVASSRQS